jgi:hypothetical protein
VLFSDDFERLNNQPQAFVSSQRGSHYTYQVAFPEVVESSLDSCRELELRVFRRALYLDCIDYLLATYGPNWNSMEQKKGRYRLNNSGATSRVLETYFGTPVRPVSLNITLDPGCISSGGQQSTSLWHEMGSPSCSKRQARLRNNSSAIQGS